MKMKGLALVVAVLVAGAATAAVFLYVQNVKKQSAAPAQTVTVIVPKQDIPAGTKLDNLISGGDFDTRQVPDDAVVPGAVTDLAQLRGRTTSTFILQGEQISTARLEGSTKATGGLLGIPAGYEALSLQLQRQAVPAQVLQPGDHVAVYASWTDIQLVSPASLRKFLAGQVAGNASNQKFDLGGWTVDLVPDAQVLRVTGQSDSTQTGDSNGIMVTLALRPTDAQRTVFAQNGGSVWLGLLPPGEKGRPQPPVSYGPDILQALERGGAK